MKKKCEFALSAQFLTVFHRVLFLHVLLVVPFRYLWIKRTFCIIWDCNVFCLLSILWTLLLHYLIVSNVSSDINVKFAYASNEHVSSVLVRWVPGTRWSSFSLFCTTSSSFTWTHTCLPVSLCQPLSFSCSHSLSPLLCLSQPLTWKHLPANFLSLSQCLSRSMPWLRGEVNRPFTHMCCLMSLYHATVTPPIHLLLLAQVIQVNEGATLFHSRLGCSSAVFIFK